VKAKASILTARSRLFGFSSLLVGAFSFSVWSTILSLSAWASFLLVGFGMQLFPASAVADQLTSRGAALAHACAACHGPEGRSQGAIPSLNTISRENFVAALQAFRSGERQGTVMNRIAKGLDDADIAAVAAYFLTAPPKGKP
jgi:cytochrome c553